MRSTLFGILTLAAIPAAVSALSPFPESAALPAQAAGNSTIALQHIYSVQETAIPGTVWGFLLLLGLAFLTISILLPERGELITGLLAMAFITPAWIQGAFLSFTEIATTTLPGNIVVIQPVTTIYASAWMPWLLMAVFFIAFGNVILAIANFLKKPVEPYPRPEVLE